MTASTAQTKESLHSELFASLASLLRSYTGLHGLHRNGVAAVEYREKIIRVRSGEEWLTLARDHEIITWTRENGSAGTVELTEAGNLRAAVVEQPMDLAAEQWARELMQ